MMKHIFQKVSPQSGCLPERRMEVPFYDEAH